MFNHESALKAHNYRGQNAIQLPTTVVGDDDSRDAVLDSQFGIVGAQNPFDNDRQRGDAEKGKWNFSIERVHMGGTIQGRSENMKKYFKSCLLMEFMGLRKRFRVRYPGNPELNQTI